MKRYRGRDEYGDLVAHIEAALAVRPATVLDLTHALDCGRTALRTRLRWLMDEGRVHYVEEITANGLGLTHTWTLGPAPEDGAPRVPRIVRDRGPIDVPTQASTRAYEPMHRRDPLVAALFGPAPTQVPT